MRVRKFSIRFLATNLAKGAMYGTFSLPKEGSSLVDSITWVVKEMARKAQLYTRIIVPHRH
jgi:hypothetical protein